MNRLVAQVVAGAAALMLVGCGSGGNKGESATEKPPTAEQAKEAAARLNRPQPGEYRQTVEITRFEIPGMTEEHAAQFRTMLAKVPASTYCLTEADADKGFKDMLDNLPGDNQCSYSRFDVDNGRLDARMECRNTSGATAKATMAGRIGPQGSEVNLDMEQTMPHMGDRKTLMSMHMKTTRLGDCDS